MDKIFTWIKSNMLLAGAGALALVLFMMPGIFKAPRKRVRHSRAYYAKRSSPVRRIQRTKSGKPLPRSVGTRRAGAGTSAKGYAAAGGGTIPFKYNKDGSVKKAWQVGGTVAAKQRMARLRRNR